MAEIAVLVSGDGTNFEAIASILNRTIHSICCVICDRKKAPALRKAAQRGIAFHYVTYFQRDRSEAEDEIIRLLARYEPKLIVLAGYMRVLSPAFVDTFPDKIVNIHPTLLPAHPGAHGIKDSFKSSDSHMGITIHRVDHGTDSGPILRQVSFKRDAGESIDSIERKIHELEHQHYPDVVLSLLENVEIGIRRYT